MTWGVLLRQNIPGCYQLKDNLQKSGNNNDGNNEYYRKWFTDEIFLRLAMLPGLDGELKQQSILFSAVNILLSITGILGNCLILVALRKESSLHLPFKLLYRCLATTDLLVGLVNHPFYTTYVVGVEIQRDCNFKAHIYYFSYRLGCMSSGRFIISSQVPCWPFVQLYGYTILPSNLNHLVRNDFCARSVIIRLKYKIMLNNNQANQIH